MTFEENIPLAPLTTFRIGGAARFFCRAASADDLAEAARFAEKHSLPIFILGGGSNLLVSDKSFDGLVVKAEMRGVDFSEDYDEEAKAVIGEPEEGAGAAAEKRFETVLVTAGAGEPWDAFVEKTVVGRGLSGLENLSWIPGTVGAAPVQNIGAYGAEAKDTIVSVDIFDMKMRQPRTLSNAECRFGYRSSIFKTPAGAHLVVMAVTFRLRVFHPDTMEVNISYRDLKEHFVQHAKVSGISPAEVREAVIAIRKRKLPDVAKVGTAGSFFKNPVISLAEYEVVAAKFPGLPSFPSQGGPADQVKVSAAWILDKICGFRGIREGDVGSYENQALALVNYGKGTSAEVAALAKRMQDAVREKTGISIEPEVVYLGSF